MRPARFAPCPLRVFPCGGRSLRRRRDRAHADDHPPSGVGPYASLRNRTPLWLACAREARGVEENGGLIFGPPRVIIENDVRPKGQTNRTDISYQRFFQRRDRYFVVYNHRKLDINVHEVDPAVVGDTGLPV